MCGIKMVKMGKKYEFYPPQFHEKDYQRLRAADDLAEGTWVSEVLSPVWNNLREAKSNGRET